MPKGQRSEVPTDAGQERRIIALDGLRGLMTIFVVVSHYFAEVPGGIRALCIGWVAVDMFFVLSGFLVGRLILEKGHHSNFFTVFYVRRVCRTFPIYFFCVVLTFAIFSQMPLAWSEYDKLFPLWSYLTFTQNFLMVSTGSIGPHWLAPTWTLAVEEHFYLFAPAVLLFTPRQHLLKVLIATAASALIVRIGIHIADFPSMAAKALFPSKMDVLAFGLIAAVVLQRGSIRWERYDVWLRVAPIVFLSSILFLRMTPGAEAHFLFNVAMDTLSAAGATCFLIAIVRGAPEAARFSSKMLCFFGNTSYAVYLSHLPILWLMHGLILGAAPGLMTWQQALVTCAAVPVCIAVGFILTKLVEEPITAYGRSWKWRNDAPAPGPVAQVSPA